MKHITNTQSHVAHQCTAIVSVWLLMLFAFMPYKASAQGKTCTHQMFTQPALTPISTEKGHFKNLYCLSYDKHSADVDGRKEQTTEEYKLPASGHNFVNDICMRYGEKDPSSIIITDNSVAFSAIEGTVGFHDEGYDKLFDNDVNTKWCFDGRIGFVIFKASKPGTLVGYSITTANDNATTSGRNPKSWIISGANSIYGPWTELTYVTYDTLLKDVNFTKYDFDIDSLKADKYEYFKWEIAGEQNTRIMQISEFTPHLVTCAHTTDDNVSTFNVDTVAFATCKDYAYEIRKCSLCHIKVKVVIGNEYDVHQLIKHEAKEPTCTEDGNNEYYECSVCGNYFKDAEGENKTGISNIIIAAKGHHYVDGVCSVCGEKSEILNVITADGVDITYNDFGSLYPWKYDADKQRIVSTNQGIAYSKSKINFIAHSDKDFLLEIDCGSSNRTYYSQLVVKVDNVPSTQFFYDYSTILTYKLSAGKYHKIEIIYANSYDNCSPGELGYVKSINATTDFTDDDFKKKDLYLIYLNNQTTLKYDSHKDIFERYSFIKPYVIENPNAVSKDIPSDFHSVNLEIDQSVKDFPITSMKNFFAGYKFKSINGLENLNTANVEDFSNAFANNENVVEMDLTGLNTESATDMSYMFSGNTNLKTIYVSDKFSTNKVKNSSDMFAGDANLIGAVAKADNSSDGSDMANYQTGYFKSFYTLNGARHELFGKDLKVENLDLVVSINPLITHVPFTAKRANFTITFEEGGEFPYWNAICLPFALNSLPAGCRAFTYGGLKNDGENEGETTLVLNEIQSIEAGRAFLVYVTDSTLSKIVFNAEDAAIATEAKDNSADATDGLYLKGSFGKPLQADDGFAFNGNNFTNMENVLGNTYYSSAAFNKLPFAILASDFSTDVTSKLGVINFAPVLPTSIGTITTGTEEGKISAIYDASGRCTNCLQHGINIIRYSNGKSIKVLVK